MKDYEQMHKQLLDEINHELDAERRIEEYAAEIAGHLVLSKKHEVDIEGSQYLMSYAIAPGQKNTRTIVMMAVNTAKYELTQGKYIPFRLTAEMNESMSLRENLEMMVDAFIRHLTGRIQSPDELDE